MYWSVSRWVLRYTISIPLCISPKSVRLHVVITIITLILCFWIFLTIATSGRLVASEFLGFLTSGEPQITPAASDGSQSFSPQLSNRQSDTSNSWPPHCMLSIQYLPVESEINSGYIHNIISIIIIKSGSYYYGPLVQNANCA